MKVIGILTLLSLFSCQVKLKEFRAPSDVIPKDSLSLILQEIMLVEYQVQSKYPLPQQFQDCVKKSGDTILSRYQVTYQRFDRSMTYYGSKQEEMQEIYDTVLERLSEKLNRMQPQVVK